MISSSKPTVLIVDDSDTIRRLLRLYLRGDEFEVIGEARDAETAVTMVAEHRPSIVLMDVLLPGMDGYEATQQITLAFPDTLVIIISGAGEADAARKAMAAGARDFLVKPLSREGLLATLRQLHETPTAVLIHGSGRADARGTGSWCFLGMNVGDGRSTLMASLAFELMTGGRKVLMIDTNPLFGDLCFQLGMFAESPAITELLNHASFLNERVIHSHIRDHDSGLKVLGGALTPEDAFAMDSARLVELMPVLEEEFEYVLVDISGGLPEPLAPLLDRARFVFPSDRADPGGIRNLEQLVHILTTLGYRAPKLKPVVLGIDDRGAEYWVEGTEIEEAIGVEDDPMIRYRAIKQGQPVPRVEPQSAMTRSARGLCQDLLSPKGRIRSRPSSTPGEGAAKTEDQPAAKGFLARLLNR